MELKKTSRSGSSYRGGSKNSHWEILTFFFRMEVCKVVFKLWKCVKNILESGCLYKSLYVFKRIFFFELNSRLGGGVLAVLCFNSRCHNNLEPNAVGQRWRPVP